MGRVKLKSEMFSESFGETKSECFPFFGFIVKLSKGSVPVSVKLTESFRETETSESFPSFSPRTQDWLVHDLAHDHGASPGAPMGLLGWSPRLFGTPQDIC